MIDPQLIEKEFSAFLNTPQNIDAIEPEASQTDLFSLFIELAALKNEVKCESRMVKTAFDEFKGVFDTLQNSQQTLQGELDHARKNQREQQNSILKPLLLDWIDMRDRMVMTLESLDRFQPGKFAAFFRRKRNKLMTTLREGQMIALKRLDDRLLNYQVEPIKTIGQNFNPHFMNVQDVVSNPEFKNGIVIAEQRRGFTWEEGILRTAEVTVNKIELDSDQNRR